MKYCNKCGAQLNDNDVFCTRCGNTVAQPEPMQQGFAPVNTNLNSAQEGAVLQAKQKKLKILTIVLIAIAVLFVAFTVFNFSTSKIVEPKDYGSDPCELGDYVSIDIAYIEPMARLTSVDSKTKEVQSVKSYYCLAITPGNRMMIANVSKNYYDEELADYSNNYDFDYGMVKDITKTKTLYAEVKPLDEDLIELYNDVFTSDTIASLNHQQLDVRSSQKEEMNGVTVAIAMLLFVSFFPVLIIRSKVKKSLKTM